MQVPAPVKLTTPEAMAHAPAVEEASMVKVTANPEVAVAVGVYDAPPTVALVGAVEV